MAAQPASESDPLKPWFLQSTLEPLLAYKRQVGMRKQCEEMLAQAQDEIAQVQSIVHSAKLEPDSKWVAVKRELWHRWVKAAAYQDDPKQQVRTLPGLFADAMPEYYLLPGDRLVAGWPVFSSDSNPGDYLIPRDATRDDKVEQLHDYAFIPLRAFQVLIHNPRFENSKYVYGVVEVNGQKGVKAIKSVAMRTVVDFGVNIKFSWKNKESKQWFSWGDTVECVLRVVAASHHIEYQYVTLSGTINYTVESSSHFSKARQDITPEDEEFCKKRIWDTNLALDILWHVSSRAPEEPPAESTVSDGAAGSDDEIVPAATAAAAASPGKSQGILRRVVQRPLGLLNLVGSNICYANSVLQCLLHVEKFRASVESSKQQSDISAWLNKNFQYLQDEKNEPIMLNLPEGWARQHKNQQEEAYKFLEYLVHGSRSTIFDMKMERFSNPKKIEPGEEGRSSGTEFAINLALTGGNPDQTIGGLLRDWQKTYEYQIFIRTLPAALVLAFSVDLGDDKKVQQLSRMVTTEKEVCLYRQSESDVPQQYLSDEDWRALVRPKSADEGLYELVAIVWYQSVTQGSEGHYIASVKKKGTWFIINDTSVERTDTCEPVIGFCPCLAFYS